LHLPSSPSPPHSLPFTYTFFLLSGPIHHLLRNETHLRFPSALIPSTAESTQSCPRSFVKARNDLTRSSALRPATKRMAPLIASEADIPKSIGRRWLWYVGRRHALDARS
jgi:hypothetical protein